jgi:hypothetical protein
MASRYNEGKAIDAVLRRIETRDRMARSSDGRSPDCLNDPAPAPTTRLRAALIPATNGAGLELAKLVKAGAASCEKRCAANLLCRMAISSKISMPYKLRFWHTARR